MDKIEQQITRFNSLDLNKMLDDSIFETQEQLLDLVRSQLEVGVKGTGEYLKDYAEQSYADFKKNIVGSLAPYFTPDLKLTGSFYSEFFITTNQLAIDVDSKDYKANALEKKYGNSIFNLTSDNLDKYAWDVIYPVLMPKIRKHLGY